MPADKYERLVKALERLGIATVICGALLWGIWEVACWCGENVVKPIIDEQVAVMRWVRESGNRRDVNEAKTSQALTDLATEIRGARREAGFWRRMIEKNVAFPGPGDKPIAVQPAGDKEPEL